MTDPFDPYDPFDPGWPFDDPVDPFNDPLDPLGDGIGTGPFSEDTTPGMSYPAGPMVGPPGVAGSVMDPFDPTIGMDDRVEHSPAASEALEPAPDAGPDILDEVEASILSGQGSGPLVFEILDVVEGSIEEGQPQGNEPHPSDEEPGQETWPQLQEDRQGEAEQFEELNGQRFYGVRSPDPRIESKPGYTHERRPDVKLWRPRGSSGLRRSSLSRQTDRKDSSRKAGRKVKKAEQRECPASGEVVLLAECESCRYYKDSTCTWRPEEEAKNEEQGDEDKE